MDGYKRLFYAHRRDLLVSIYSVKVGRGLDGWIQKIILYTLERFISEYILCEGWQMFGWMDTKDYFIHIGEIY